MPTHLIDTIDLSKTELEEILERAAYWEANLDQPQPLQGKFVANLFFEPSTRTRFSFEVAEKRLGMQVLNFQTAVSSTTKGESLIDTVKTLEAIGVEAIVIRHREPQEIKELFNHSLQCAVINAGAGKWAHPTQALLDLYTIKKYFGNCQGLCVAIVGDISHSRVVRSNLWSLRAFGIDVILSGPPSMRDLECEQLAPYVPMDEAIRQADVVMMLRVQLERHDQQLFQGADDYLSQYGLTTERLQVMKPESIIMHPAPVNRGVEIAHDLVEHPKSKIFEQMSNGVFIRMAVLERAFGGIINA
ncbi:aspartate carbamoyltransferase catalytic subunit [Hazenella coriacea]|uniref:Aspartate carbamoyltransferase n=1 Tax=Hazenella coriacea TaxID=1179467 RepID=A0A4R3L5D6_9BACL|nr:aspartate carbamoyltransferase catalytic subunit [Hazenella coriacea]TCS94602.1 aspartate carbamoyltransferase [Hazenella coriacea]